MPHKDKVGVSPLGSVVAAIYFPEKAQQNLLFLRKNGALQSAPGQ